MRSIGLISRARAIDFCDGGNQMRKQASVNKIAWEYRAYEHLKNQNGSPAEKALSLKSDPLADFRYHKKYFENVNGKKIAIICGASGRKAVPLAMLGATVSVFDLSEENQRYALELAEEAGVHIQYVLGDFCEANLDEHGEKFDIVFGERGVIHYFSEINVFAKVLYSITKKNGMLILSDFHPYKKINSSGSDSKVCVPQTEGNYFDTRLHSVNVAYQNFFPICEQELFPTCLQRYYNLSEIINAIIDSGFLLKKFLEHPYKKDTKIPEAFTIIAYK